MIWVAIFGGFYRFAEVTGHIATNHWVIEQFLPKSLTLTEKSIGKRL